MKISWAKGVLDGNSVNNPALDHPSAIRRPLPSIIQAWDAVLLRRDSGSRKELGTFTTVLTQF